MLRLGYFENFESADAVVLISGDAESLGFLADLLRSLEDVNSAPVAVHTLPFVDAHHRVELTAFPVDRGILRLALPEQAGRKEAVANQHSAAGFAMRFIDQPDKDVGCNTRDLRGPNRSR